MTESVQQLYRRSVVALCLALALLLVIALTVFTVIDVRSSYKRELTTQAGMLATQLATQGHLAHGQSIAKQATINSSLILVCVSDAQGVLRLSQRGRAFAGIFDDKILDRDACQEMKESSRVRAHAIITPSQLPKAIGRVYLYADMPPLLPQLGSALLVVVLITALFGLTCALIGEKLRRVLLRPLRQIAATAQRVSLYKDYSLRVTPGALDVVPSEIASLIDSLNAMLKEIEDRDSRLMRKTIELEKARAASEAANAAKSQFLANVSHELRTPLNAIIGFSTMMREQQFGPLDAKYVEYSRDIHDSGRHLLDVINDILDLSKAEAGKLTVKFEALQLPKLIDKALHIVAGQAHQSKIDIYTDLPPKLPQIVADRVRLVQILLNLLSNAIKFTGEGGRIVVHVRVEAGKNGVHYFTLEVEDNGIGMSEEEQRKAFQTFNQADAGLNRKYEGAGLGLPLTKRLVELHHGKIKIESSKGTGTKVTVRLTSDPALLD